MIIIVNELRDFMAADINGFQFPQSQIDVAFTQVGELAIVELDGTTA